MIHVHVEAARNIKNAVAETKVNKKTNEIQHPVNCYRMLFFSLRILLRDG